MIILPTVLGCAQHTKSPLARREQVNAPTDWTYEASYNWGAINPSYAVCQTGTQQSPIALSLNLGLSQYHHPTFHNYNRTVNGSFSNWGYGPSYTLAEPDVNSSSIRRPTLKYDNETLYLQGWHVHTPAEHSVAGDRSKGELHLLHVDADGHKKAVVAIRLDPGTSTNAFFAQLPAVVHFNDTSRREGVEMKMSDILESVSYFNEFWTYKGSLTSPPCEEGLRWFMARKIAYTSVEQMRAILGASKFSARVEQKVWLHEINSAW
ncbi:MAG: hypothetical protein Q9163_000545 [Psora crenata]